ncbi:sensor histidine kinase [Gramella sp. KN1008]|uniref:sensor histidine kinase n=1 Tax=Gramella sp. KN1008 TaxID=2529298 RepID=UPI0013F17DF8|nr:histidine kinase [Gramella sp. KN1008]
MNHKLIILLIGFSLVLYSLELVSLWIDYNFPEKTSINYSFFQRLQFYFFDWILVVVMISVVAITSNYLFKKKIDWFIILLINLFAILVISLSSELLFLIQRSFIIEDTWSSLSFGQFLIGLIVKYKDYLYFSAPLLLVSYLFNYMKDLNLEESRRKNTEILLWKQKLKTLNFQLRPHFLFNTLNNISAIISIDKLKAQDAIAELSHFYRNITNLENDGIHSIEEELKILKSYMTIMKSKYGESLILHQNIVYKVKSVKIPSLTIQTIVENAIKHGFDNSRPLTIELSIRVTDNESVFIEITNNGKPFQDKDKNEIGIGNSNLLERFEILYGSNFIYEIKNSDNKVIVHLEYPLEFPEVK